MVLNFKKIFLVLTTFILILLLIFIGRAFATNNVQATNDPDDFCDVTVDQTSDVTANRSGDYCILSFKRVGTTVWTTPAWVSSVEYLIVAGGGGGGSRAGGGGGAGGLLTNSNYSVSGNTNLTIVVGAGGVGVWDDPGTSGEDSSFDSQVADGGGGGGAAEGSNNFERNGRSGGSGGGSAGGASADDSTPGTGIAGQGNSGGKGRNGNVTGIAGWPGGGGGGFSSNGSTSTVNNGGLGGSGFASSISGTATCYAAGGGGGTNVAYTGGTAGGCAGLTSTAGAGTAGNVNGGDATANSGSGGGGSGWASGGVDNPGGNGGSGIVVVKYSIPPRPSLPTNTATVLVDPRATSIELPLVELTSWINNRVCISISNSAGRLDLDGSDSTKYKVEISSGSGSSVEIQGSSSDQHFRISGTPAQMSDVFKPSSASKSRIKITKPSAGSFNENITLIIRSDNTPAADCQSAAPSGDPLLTATIKPYEIEINQKNEIILD